MVEISDGMVGENFEVPDLIEPLVAFRHWRLDEETGALKSPYSLFPWPERMMTAICQSSLRAEPGKHPAPAPEHGCRCGLYGYYAPDDSSAYFGGQIIYGAIKAWGKIEVHITGIRAQYAEIIAITNGPNYTAATLQDIATFYSVPLVPTDQLRHFALEHGALVPQSILNAAKTKNAELRAEKARKQAEWRAQQQKRMAEAKDDPAYAAVLRWFWGFMGA